MMIFHKLFQSFMRCLVSYTYRLHCCQVFDMMLVLVRDVQALS